MIDFHSHLIPGVDDGAVDLEQSRAALETMRAQGVRALITTPHLPGSVLSRPDRLAGLMEAMDAGWALLRGMAAAEMPELRVERGAEVALDQRDLDVSDERARLAGTGFVLVEFPNMSIPPNSGSTIFDLRMKGWKPIIAHPERYGGMGEGFSVVDEWVRMGGLLQVNCGSLLGRYGPTAERIAWTLLEQGRVSYLSSDYHARGRCPIREARDLLDERGAGEQAVMLMERNPALLLEDTAPEEVPPYVQPRRSILERVGLGRWGRAKPRR
jgi:protein-tyrosine phosphatase